ncbi:MAG: hypothetical protein JGK24_19640 [Microcoleus sp. PH2017_29_MFU_D_A]|nr:MULTISPECIES: hypothetical protein [unclassified Microcoleus]MCC3419738.1 hypothetical protein [Microcoleus sp. PH2017_07_MST_O_A]MCC3429482.1 hypothetical protein [Microcoleus sp. PH2017_04_SCI_O_A]MCC3443038.1 hypothetical protein [Microcoleus sp. PH2017_03_ELD_O_A]MCC3469480.1 hypothetical protein [Microcoleus sp. PH2017_06_SFM_O_A]MCC3506907.1 hypothetical protein [Microcoleus sp. PH2017_19_SFW_U_A]MCC3510832.1 hypothetical protein [Microcoleus sp. PH2017_17_BER_D_A]
MDVTDGSRKREVRQRIRSTDVTDVTDVKDLVGWKSEEGRTVNREKRGES